MFIHPERLKACITIWHTPFGPQVQRGLAYKMHSGWQLVAAYCNVHGVTGMVDLVLGMTEYVLSNLRIF